MATPPPLSSTPLTALEAVVLDTETTGLDASKDRLVQIGAVLVRGGEIDPSAHFETLVNPGVAIPTSASAIHGIHDRDLVAAPGPAEALAALAEFVGERAVIGYAIAFDLEILAREAAAVGQAWQGFHAVDVRPLARAVAP
ncbi:MAG: 3'-5' exonuclease, partial [Rhodovibrionaceae bacterium]